MIKKPLTLFLLTFLMSSLFASETLILAKAGYKKTSAARPKTEESTSKNIKKAFRKNLDLQEISFSLGYNIVETFGRTLYADGKYQYFFRGNKWFAEAGVGAGGWFLLESEIPLVTQGLYESDWMVNLDISLAKILGSEKKLYISDSKKRLLPYFMGGATLVYQGGFFNPGGLLGFGGIIHKGTKKEFSLHYGVKDRIYFPRVYPSKFITHNIHLYLGFQYRLGK